MAQIVCPVVSVEDRTRWEAIVPDRNRAQKHVWRARIVLHSADRLSVVEVARRADVGRPAVWRWQRRYAVAGVEHETEQERLLAKQGERGPGVQLGQQIGGIEAEDREFAIAIAHHFLDRFAEETAGRMSLDIHIHPLGKDVEDESAYRAVPVLADHPVPQLEDVERNQPLPLVLVTASSARTRAAHCDPASRSESLWPAVTIELPSISASAM